MSKSVEKLKKALKRCMMVLMVGCSIMLMVEPAFAANNMSSLELQTDRPGSDFAILNVSSAGVCSDRCSVTNTCRAMTYNSTNNNCYLKNQIPPSKPDTDGTSAYKTDANS